MTEFFIITGGLIVYFLPGLVAGKRRHHNQGAILALNLLLGWTFVGWVVALVWSLTAVAETAPTSRRDSRSDWPR